MGKLLRLLRLLRALEINLVTHYDERLLVNRLENLVLPTLEIGEGFEFCHVVDQGCRTAPTIEARANDLEAILPRHIPNRELNRLLGKFNGLRLEIDADRGYTRLFELPLAVTSNQRRLADIAIACDDYFQDGNATQWLLVTTQEVFMGEYQLIRINGRVAKQGSVGSLKKEVKLLE